MSVPNDGGAAEETVRVLHVDDDPEFLALAAELIGRESDRLEVVTATDAESGLDRLADDRIDCVVSDYDMGETDGLAFLATVRERRPGLPFILFTGQGSETIASEALSSGATDYLQKRTGTEQYAVLANRIENAVAADRAEREAAHHRRVSELVREVTRALVGAATREEIEGSVCDLIADSDPYLFAWIGRVEESSDRIRPHTSAGVEDGYLDGLRVTTDDSPTGRGPAGTAVAERRVAVAGNVRDDPSFAPWRDRALERGFRSVAGVPLIHDGTVHGVLAVYADHPGAFDATERELLADLGEAVGHAIDAIRVRDRLDRQYRDLFEEAPVMYALTRDADGGPVVVDCNQRFVDRLGYAREEVVGAPLATLYTDESAEELTSGGYERALDGEFSREERHLRTADGDVVETLLRAVPRYDPDGTTVGTFTLFVDVTDQRRARAVVSQAEAMEASIDGMAIVDSDGTLTYVNEAYASLYGRDDADALVGRSWRDLYPPDERERIAETVMPTVRREGRWEGEAVGRRPDGSTFPQETSLTELEDGGLICVVRDVTSHRETERELARRNRRLDEFASVVSHDLRNPLNIAQGNVDLARTAQDPAPHLDAAGTALDRMERIVADVLSLARGGVEADDASVVSLERTVLDCWQHADEAVTVASDLRFVADRDRLLRLLENLFRNAVEHGSTSPPPEAHGDAEGSARDPAGGSDAADADAAAPPTGRTDGGPDVEVRVGPLADGAGFFVEDDGPGIPPEVREAVFEAGYSTTRSGTGLGLAIVDRIAEGHGWDPRVTASDAGGARFEFHGVEVVERDASDAAAVDSGADDD